ncbi:MAG: hypothetical protein C4541_00765 [Candidatus Auribacter fodinae]|jgi:hypothetical protein|uniref:DUF2721 domain-containing protein n=1 Tax=Candidatus Auribacter fodinae TaxID=2093366 RepID=A0A3A4RAP5_9BACT|nr:MAG: hypothetical protein C4541_00765 [Candidatus Auribacter fodinae]
MTEDVTHLLYFYSATAQTLGTMLGIGIVALTFFASWVTQQKNRLREPVISILQYHYGHSTVFTEGKTHKLIEDFLNSFRNKEIEETEQARIDICKEYQSMKITIPQKTYIVGVSVSLATIVVSLFMCLKIIPITSQIAYVSVFAGSILSLSCFLYLALYILQPLKCVS